MKFRFCVVFGGTPVCRLEGCGKAANSGFDYCSKNHGMIDKQRQQRGHRSAPHPPSQTSSHSQAQLQQQNFSVPSHCGFGGCKRRVTPGFAFCCFQHGRGGVSVSRSIARCGLSTCNQTVTPGFRFCCYDHGHVVLKGSSPRPQQTRASQIPVQTHGDIDQQFQESQTVIPSPQDQNLPDHLPRSLEDIKKLKAGRVCDVRTIMDQKDNVLEVAIFTENHKTNVLIRGRNDIWKLDHSWSSEEAFREFEKIGFVVTIRDTAKSITKTERLVLMTRHK